MFNADESFAWSNDSSALNALNNGNTQANYMTIFNRFGEVVPMARITMPQATNTQGLLIVPQTAPPCNAGIFRLTFADNGTATGFDDAVLGSDRRAVLCRVFTDLSSVT